MNLNLGAADRHVPNFLCVDIAPPSCVICDSTVNRLARRVDLSLAWPWPDSSIEEILAFDVAEHIPDADRDRIMTLEEYRAIVASGKPAPTEAAQKLPRSGRIHFMNELWRVLVPGGRATIETPNATKGVGFAQDLTHCQPYCLSSFKYVEHGAFARERLGDAYGITARFKVLSLTESRSNGEDPREEVWKIKAVMECVK